MYHVAYTPIQNYDHIRLEFKGIGASGFLGCSDNVCDLRSCPYYNYIRTGSLCEGEQFRILVENGGTIESGERVRFQSSIGSNQWLGYPISNRCDKRPCPGRLSQGANFNRLCTGETFRIYAHDKGFGGQTIHNGDLVMIYLPPHNFYGGKYISIQGYKEMTDTSMDYCPGRAPPLHDHYTSCSNNVFRIYKD